jgi:acetyltransferase-like isoleucine patch superfamily enzyme|tara:strand:+ start:159 stop:848 length:690 start_codon:yes stop_codon:yes gene_type:complete
MIINAFNKIVQLFKGNHFEVDKRVPINYILSISFSKVIDLLFGVIKLKKIGPYFISPSTKIVARKLIKLKGNIQIQHSCLINALSTEGIVFGNNVSIHPYCSLESSGSILDLGKGIIIGDNVGIGRNCHFGGAGGITIGDDTIFGQYVSIHSENHNFSKADMKIRNQGVSRQGIKIGSNCWIGAKVTILDGAIINDGCVIAASALVRAGVYEKNTIYGGVPAKKIKSRF